jgi:hypothetical protein
MLRLVGGVNKAGGAVATSHEKARVTGPIALLAS